MRFGTPRSSPETAGRHLVAEVPTARIGDRVGPARASLSGRRFASTEALYVLNESGRLCGLVRLADLLALPEEAALKDVMRSEPPSVRPETDQERVASLAVWHRIGAVPVVDSGGVFLGVVPPEALLEVLRREHVEDLHRLAGIRREAAHARHALEEPPVRRVKDRLPWLMLGMLGSALATFVVARFERELEAQVALAFFVPGIVYLADAIGTQTETVVVRGLSLSQAPLRVLLRDEAGAGLLIGSVFGALAFLGVALAFGDVRLAAAVALAVLVAGGMATTIGLLFPWLLYRLGKDPAFGSGPVATIVQDVLSLLIYFVFGSWLLA